MESEFDGVAGDYNRQLRENLGILGRNLDVFAEYKVKILRRHVSPPPKRILEFGCGVGRNLPHLRHCFPEAEIAACDNSDLSLAEAARTAPEARLFAAATPDEFRNRAGRHDLCFMAGVLHHIAPPERGGWLAAIREVLADGGQFFIFEHNPWNPLTRRLVSTCAFDRGASLISRRDAVRLSARCGFVPLKSAYALFFPWRTAALEAIEGCLGWLPLGGQYYVQGGAEMNE